MESESKKQKNSKMEKAKKNIATKFAKSKIGESIIKRNIGEEGYVLLISMCICLEPVLGKKEVKIWKKNVFKFAIKAARLFEKKQVSMEKARELKHPLEECLQNTANILNMWKEKASHEEIQKMAEFIHEKNAALSEQIAQLFEGKMQKENIDLLKKTILVIDSDDILLIFKGPNQLEMENVRLGAIKILEKFNIFSPGLHKIKLSNYVFYDHFSSAIDSTIIVWKKVCQSRKPEEMGELVLQKFITRESKYEQILKSLPKGDNTTEQGVVLFDFVSFAIKNLQHWEEFCEHASKVKEEMSKWSEKVVVSKAHLMGVKEALLEAVKDVLQDQFSDSCTKMFDVLSNQVVNELL